MNEDLTMPCPHCGEPVYASHNAIKRHEPDCPRTLVVPYLTDEMRERLYAAMSGEAPVGDTPITWDETYVIEGQAVRVETPEERLIEP